MTGEQVSLKPNDNGIIEIADEVETSAKIHNSAFPYFAYSHGFAWV